MLTLLRSDLLALARDLREALNCILAQISLVHTNTMNIILNPNPITVITKFIPGVIIFTLFFFLIFFVVYTIPKNTLQFASLFL